MCLCKIYTVFKSIISYPEQIIRPYIDRAYTTVAFKCPVRYIMYKSPVGTHVENFRIFIRRNKIARNRLALILGYLIIFARRSLHVCCVYEFFPVFIFDTVFDPYKLRRGDLIFHTADTVCKIHLNTAVFRSVSYIFVYGIVITGELAHPEDSYGYTSGHFICIDPVVMMLVSVFILELFFTQYGKCVELRILFGCDRCAVKIHNGVIRDNIIK